MRRMAPPECPHLQARQASLRVSDILSAAHHEHSRHHVRMMLKCLAVLRFSLSLPQCPGHVSASLKQQLQVQMMQEQFCMQKELFALMADVLYHNPVKALNSSGCPIQPEVLLLMAIRWCSGA